MLKFSLEVTVSSLFVHAEGVLCKCNASNYLILETLKDDKIWVEHLALASPTPNFRGTRAMSAVSGLPNWVVILCCISAVDSCQLSLVSAV